jgi:hypothetical protein
MDSRYYVKMIMGVLLILLSCTGVAAGVPKRRTWAVAVSGLVMPLAFVVLAYNECPLQELL